MVNRITSRTYVDEYGVLYFDVAMEKDDGSVQEKRLCAEDYFQLFQKGTVAQEGLHENPDIFFLQEGRVADQGRRPALYHVEGSDAALP